MKFKKTKEKKPKNAEIKKIILNKNLDIHLLVGHGIMTSTFPFLYSWFTWEYNELVRSNLFLISS